MLKNLFVTILVLFFVAFVPAGFYFLSYSQSPTLESQKVKYILPYPGILPDNPLYVLKNLRDKILEIITRDHLKKAQLYLLFSDKKAAMAINLEKKGKEQLALKIIDEAEHDFQKIKGLLNTSKKQSSRLDAELISKIKLSNLKHHEIIETLIKAFPQGNLENLREVLKLNEQIGKDLKSL